MYWAVDDMKIIETDDFDIKLQGIVWGTDGAGSRLPYSYVPSDQVAPINFAGITKILELMTLQMLFFQQIYQAFLLVIQPHH